VLLNSATSALVLTMTLAKVLQVPGDKTATYISIIAAVPLLVAAPMIASQLLGRRVLPQLPAPVRAALAQSVVALLMVVRGWRYLSGL
jgi:hypothetical protein